MVVVTMMVVTIMVIKIFVYGDVFKENNFCYPPAFYFGDVESGRMFMNAYNNQDTSRGHKTDSKSCIPLIRLNYKDLNNVLPPCMRII